MAETITMMRNRLLLTVLLLLPLAGFAHVGSPDIYYDGQAGQYHLLVTIRPPAVIPGIAEIQVRSASNDVAQIEILPLRMVGPGAKLAPKPDTAERSTGDPQLFNGHLWIMDRGSWKVQVNVNGQHGKAELAVPVPAVSTTSAKMQKTLGLLLSVLGLLLVAGFVGIVGAANRDAKVDPENDPTPAQRRRGLISMGVAAVLMIGVLVFANWWWGLEASANAKLSYRLPHLQSSLEAGSTLQLHLKNPNEAAFLTQFGMERADRLRLDDLVTDHGHLMHLFLVRMPDMKSFWHLHPSELKAGDFSEDLPGVPAGHYRIYADIVHKTGFPETEVGEIDLPGTAAKSLAVKPLNNDDSGGADLSTGEKVSQLSGGYRMVWERDPAPLKTKQPIWFRFRIEDKNGNPATDLESYMGMAGHAAFIRDDGEVFAHVHPAGSVSMAAAEMAQEPSTGSSTSMGMNMNHGAPSAEVSFPYGFSQSGDYHIYVQVKRAGQVETGVFVAHVE
ncbi:MAG TPA: hypothetical protein VNV88_02585 [Candidatus Solibacter sp.]|nr:hypothetical protein [Candidatus Solibacter sp.]